MQTFLLQSVFRPLFIHRQRRQWKSIIIELVCIVAHVVSVLCCVVHLVRKIFTQNANISFAICFLTSFYSPPKKSLKSGTLIIELVCIVARLVFVLCCIVPHPNPNPNPNPNLRKNLLGGQSSREAILQGGNFSVTALRDSLSKPKCLSEGNRYFQTVYCLAYIT